MIRNSSYKFGPFLLNVEGMTLRREGQPIQLPPKAFETLVVLVRERGEMVSKERLMLALWPDAHVEESNLTQNVFVLRRKLGKTPENEEYIQTVPRRGYRIGVPVEELAGDTPPAPAEPIAQARQPSPRRVWPLWAGMLLIASLTLPLWWAPGSAPTASTYLEISYDGADKRGETGAVGGPDAPLATDGSRIYFTEGSSQTSALMQVSAAGGETAAIPVPFALPQLLDFSSARSELLAASLENPASAAPLWAIPVPAGVPHRLVARDASWSPDGHEIAYVRGTDLFRSNDEGTAIKKLATLPGLGWRPRWSPDSKILRLTVVDAKNASQSLWEISSDGSNLHPLLPGWSNPPAECCGSWTPDGAQFVFQATREGKTEIWSLASRGIANWFRGSTRTPVQITNGQIDSLTPVVSPDGRKLYFIGRRLRGELAKYDPATRQFLPYLGGIPADFIDFSRDGRWITYVTFPEGTLWRSRIDGGERLQLTFAPMEVMVPQWSPDGKRIAFVGVGAGRKNRVYVVPAGGGTPEAIPQADGGLGPTWSPDGDSLLFSDAPFFATKPGKVAVHKVNWRTREMETIRGSEGLFSPAWSPDGRYIVAKPQTGRRTMLFDTQTQTWSELAEGWGFTKWSPDSQYMYYMRYGAQPAILRIHLGNRKVEEVASLSGIRQGGRLAGLQFALAPDGCPTLLRDTGTQEIYSTNAPNR
jgi:Tol biopolymer transport system component/DNA-binding winged helix-turn-helix (wHTH) protein